MTIQTGQIITHLIPFEPVIINQIKANNSKVSIIRGLPNPELQEATNKTKVSTIRVLANPEFTIKGIHFINLFSRTLYSHFIEFIYLEAPLKKVFYKLECLKTICSVNYFKKQINSKRLKV
jgi:hypothetical protein